MSKHFSLAPLSLLALAGLATLAPQPDEPLVLKTKYTAGLTLATRTEITHESEVTAMSMTRDGEEVDMSGRTGGPSTVTRTAHVIDAFKAAKEGQPTEVHRMFVTLSESSSRMRRDEEVVRDSNGPLEGVLLGLTIEDDELVVDVLDGSEPDDEDVLEGHVMKLGLDALLPQGEVALGDEWDFDGGALMAALGFDLDKQLFPQVAPEMPTGGGGPGGGGGGFGGERPAPTSFAQVFVDADWDGEAKLADELEDMDGLACYVIEFSAEGEAEVEDRGFGGFGGRGGRALEPLSAFTVPMSLADATLKIEGKLYFSKEELRPVALEAEATTTTESDTTRESRNGGEIHSTSTTEGKLTISIHVEPAELYETE